ncbi:MAG: hypothetical protein ACREIV_09035, partial [Planctomycetaceae bacterium]
MPRRLRIGGLLAVVLLLTTGWLRAEDAPRETQAVKELISKLDADERAVRAAAERQLLELGPRILPQLPPPDLLPPAAQAALRRIRRQLEHTAARAAVRPSRITLTGTRPLREWLGLIVQQTGNDLDASALPAETLETPLAVDYDAETFWIVLDDLARRAGFRYETREKDKAHGPRPVGSSSPLILVPGEAATGEQAVDSAGAFRVAVLSAEVRPLQGEAER